MIFLRTLCAVLCLSIFGSLAVLAQKIETTQANRDGILRVETALNHLTVIEVAEPITMVAAGSPAFKIERRENKVFIQPLEEEQSTNLFIWTAAHRYSYELAPAGSVSAMHFAIDHRKPVSVARDESAAESQTDSTEAAVKALIQSVPIRWQGSKPDDHRVTVVFKDVLKLADRWLIRYGVSNRSGESYPLRAPRIVLMREPTSRLSLLPLSGAQLGPREASHVRSQRREVIDPIQSPPDAGFVTPGQEAMGVVGIPPLVKSAKPMVLQFQFPADRRGRVTGTLVL
jgi:Conjugal transfer protein